MGYRILFSILLLAFFGNIYPNDKYDVSNLPVPDSLKQNYLKADNAQKEIDCLNNICFTLNNTMPERSIELAKKTLRISDSINYLFGQYEANNNLGIAFYRTTRYTQAISCFQEAYKLAKKINNDGFIAATLSNMALVYNELGDFEKSLELNNNALKIRTKQKDNSAIAISYNNIGMTYHLKGEYYQALTYYTKALTIRTKENDKEGQANVYNNMGQLFFDMYDNSNTWAIDSAIHYFLKAYTAYIALDNRIGVAKTLLNIANIYSAQESDDRAIDAYRAALNIMKQISDSAGIALAYYNMGVHFMNLNENKRAIDHFNISLSIAKRHKIATLIKDNLKQLFLASSDQCIKACGYAHEYFSIDDSINELSRHQLIEQYQGRLEFQAFENQELQNQYSSIKIWLIIISSLFVLLLIIFFWLLFSKFNK